MQKQHMEYKIGFVNFYACMLDYCHTPPLEEPPSVEAETLEEEDEPTSQTCNQNQSEIVTKEIHPVVRKKRNN